MNLLEQILPGISTDQREPLFSGDYPPDEFGLVHVGGSLDVPTVIEAYTNGVFPWTGAYPIPWFSPDPRLILFPGAFRASKKLRRLSRQNRLEIRIDTDFRSVMEQCASIPRKNEAGTWITQNMIDVYCSLHDLHIAHSVEIYENGELCGGLYGLAFGRAFFGESMFSAVSNASKLALYTLCRLLAQRRFHFIDCQQVSLHLLRLGATAVPRKKYLEMLDRALAFDTMPTSWSGWV